MIRPATTLDPGRYATLRRIVTDPAHRLVLSLGGGSVPGLCGNLALVAVLEELGLRAHVAEVWGTSAGAAIGGAFASGTDARTMLALVGGLKRGRAVRLRGPRVALSLLLRPLGARLPEGLVDASRLRETVARGLAVASFEDCAIPFRCVACSDDGRAARKVFRRGPLLPAISASMALPGVVDPEPWDDGEGIGYMDGGLVEKTPLLSPIADHQRRGDGRRLVLLCTHFRNEARHARPRGFLQRFLYSLYALENLAWSYQLAEARMRRDVTLLLLRPRLDDPQLFDFGNLERHFESARSEYAECLQDARIGLTFGME